MNSIHESFTRSAGRIQLACLRTLRLVEGPAHSTSPKVIVLDEDARQRALSKKFDRQAIAWRKLGLTMDCA